MSRKTSTKSKLIYTDSTLNAPENLKETLQERPIASTDLEVNGSEDIDTGKQSWNLNRLLAFPALVSVTTSMSDLMSYPACPEVCVLFNNAAN